MEENTGNLPVIIIRKLFEKNHRNFYIFTVVTQEERH